MKRWMDDHLPLLCKLCIVSSLIGFFIRLIVNSNWLDLIPFLVFHDMQWYRLVLWVLGETNLWNEIITIYIFVAWVAKFEKSMGSYKLFSLICLLGFMIGVTFCVMTYGVSYFLRNEIYIHEAMSGFYPIMISLLIFHPPGNKMQILFVPYEFSPIQFALLLVLISSLLAERVDLGLISSLIAGMLFKSSCQSLYSACLPSTINSSSSETTIFGTMDFRPSFPGTGRQLQPTFPSQIPIKVSDVDRRISMREAAARAAEERIASSV